MVDSVDKALQRKIVNRFYEVRIENRENEYLHPSYQLERRLLTAIQMGNKEEALRSLRRINGQERAKLSSNSVRSLKNSIICSCTIFTRAAIESGVHPENAYNLSDALIQQIENIHDKKDLENFEVNMVYTFIKTIQEEQIPNYSPIVRKAVSYIHKQILSDLTLQNIAEKLYVNPSYLSTIFKRETNTSLTDYINRKKIEESKYFLLHSPMTISTISSLFHFCNQSYYTSVFRRITGLTPNKFRELKKV